MPARDPGARCSHAGVDQDHVVAQLCPRDKSRAVAAQHAEARVVGGHEEGPARRDDVRLISTTVMSACGNRLRQYLGSEPPPRPIISIAFGCATNSRQPIIMRV